VTAGRLALLRRMLARSPGELVTRARQKAHVVGERAVLAITRSAGVGRGNGSGGRLQGWRGPDHPSPLGHFRARATPRFFPGLAHRDSAVAELRRRWPDAEPATIAAADRILTGSFDLLGYRDLRFGSPPDWHLDPLRNVRAPASVHWSRIDYLDPAVAGDHKVVWEVNRHQYLVTLGQAYWYTGDERYAVSFVQHLTSWMDRNPARLGINWASSLEVSFRAMSWLWALHFFRGSAALTDPFFERVLHFLRLHGCHIERYLSTYFSPNTHLTGEALGLFYLGTLLPEFRDAARWRRTGLRIFAAEMPRQVLPDGVYFEQSTWYHRYTLDFLVHLLVLAGENDIDPGSRHAATLERMLEHVLALTRPDGTVPLIGDDDGGSLLPVDGPPTRDFRAALATGAALFGRSDFKYMAGAPARETLWLLGTRGLAQYDALPTAEPAARSTAFHDGGFYVMRDGWGTGSGYLLIDGGPHGSLSGGHAHADALAVVASCGTENVLVDAGTGTYTTDPEIRDGFRSSLAHNTVSIDGLSSAVSGGPFRWESTATTAVDAWISVERFDYFRGRQDGFARLALPAVHERAVLFIRDAYWIMRDHVEMPGPGIIESRFHFAAHLSVARAADGQGIVASSRGAPVPLMRVHTLGASTETLLEPYSVSDVYGSFLPATRATFRATADGGAELVTLLLPGHDAAAAEICRLEQPTGVGLTVGYGPYLDWIIIGGAPHASGAGVSTDFAWAWLRRCAVTGSLLDYVLIDGSHLELDGMTIVQLDKPTAHACMNSRAGQ
jgi:hypothetical protein